MGRGLAVCRGTGRKGSDYSDGHVVREIGQSKVGEDRLEQVSDLTVQTDVQWLHRNRKAHRVDRALGSGLVLLPIRRVLDESRGTGTLAVQRVASVRVRGLTAQALRDDLCRGKAGLGERGTEFWMGGGCWRNRR